VRSVCAVVSILCSLHTFPITDGMSAARRRIPSKEHVLIVYDGDDFETAFRRICTGIVAVVFYTTPFSLCSLHRKKDIFFTHILILVNIV